MGSVVVYHFEVRSSASPGGPCRSVPRRGGRRGAGFEPLMETARVVERAMLDPAGFLPVEAPGGG
jgi:hypothetical protein